MLSNGKISSCVVEIGPGKVFRVWARVLGWTAGEVWVSSACQAFTLFSSTPRPYALCFLVGG